MKQYGDPHKILLTCQLEIKKWPQVYKKFGNFPIKYKGLTDARNWNLFHSPDMLCILILKILMANGNVNAWV